MDTATITKTTFGTTRIDGDLKWFYTVETRLEDGGVQVGVSRMLPSFEVLQEQLREHLAALADTDGVEYADDYQEFDLS